ncbi:MAG: ABC transporter permease [Flexilinea sp.]
MLENKLTVEKPEFVQTGVVNKIKKFFINYPSIIILSALVIFGAFFSPVFFTSRNLINILWSISVLGIISIGQTVLMITGNFDMSVAYIVGLSGITTVMLQIQGADLLISVAGGLAAGVFIGFLNGVIIILTNANAFLITLGTSALVYSINLILTQSKTWYAQIDAFLILGRGKFLGTIHYSVIIFITMAVIVEIILRKTIIGRSMYIIGLNMKSARFSGIQVNALKFGAYIFCGFCAGLAGLVMTARTGSTVANAGVGLEFDSLIVSVLGGTSLYGGKGGTVRTIVGILILGVINNLLILLNVQYEAQQIAKGIVFLTVVCADGILEKKRR